MASFQGGILVLERVYLTIECFTSFNLSRMMAFNVAFPVGNDWVRMRDPKWRIRSFNWQKKQGNQILGCANCDEQSWAARMTIFPIKWRANEQLGGGWAPTSKCQSDLNCKLPRKHCWVVRLQICEICSPRFLLGGNDSQFDLCMYFSNGLVQPPPRLESLKFSICEKKMATWSPKFRNSSGFLGVFGHPNTWRILFLPAKMEISVLLDENFVGKSSL